ncbi:MAG: N-formylglutamate amidohydrolase [Sphingomonadaceae bacterium]
MEPNLPFVRIGPDEPRAPLVFSVPHAGRGYRPELLAAAALPRDLLERLEDRLADRLIWRALGTGATAIVANAPRAEIDLNRAENEIDPAATDPPGLPGERLCSARSRAGLGLVPTALPGRGPIWKRPVDAEEVARRIAAIHRPYHEALGEALAAARDRFGIALLVDVHSMPGGEAADIVFGDLHGRSMAADLVDCALSAATRLGFTASRNNPYAGGHVVARHGRPHEAIHALQIEIRRGAYLDAARRGPGPGFDRATKALEAVAQALVARAFARGAAEAAE